MTTGLPPDRPEGDLPALRPEFVAGWVDDGVERLESVWGLDVPERRYRIRL
jgi:hypothetical protein